MIRTHNSRQASGRRTTPSTGRPLGSALYVTAPETNSCLNINSSNNNELPFHRLTWNGPSLGNVDILATILIAALLAQPVRPAFLHYVVCCQVYIMTESLKSLHTQYEWGLLIDMHNGPITAYINTVYIHTKFHSKNVKYTYDFKCFPRPEMSINYICKK